MDILKTFLGGAAIVSILWFMAAAFYILLPILIWLDARGIRRATEQQAELTRQLLRAYGHEPEA